MNLLKLIRTLQTVSIFKTIWYNLKLLPKRDFFKFYLIIGKNVIIKNSGEIRLFNYHKGRIHIGSDPLFNVVYNIPLLINNNGVLRIGGKTCIQPGVILFTSKDGKIELMGNNRIGTRTQILSKNSVSMGCNSECSWDCQICDSDFHFLENLDTHDILPNTKRIIIGADVWIGNHVIIGKGVHIPNGCIVGQNSYVNKTVNEENKIIVGSPAKILSGRYERVWDLAKERQLSQINSSESLQ